MKNIKVNHEQLWEHWFALRGSHPRVDAETTRKMKDLGFFAGAHLWYDFRSYSPSLYLNDRAMCFLHPINGWLSKMVDDKRFLPLLFKNRPDLVPDLTIGIEDAQAKYVLEQGQSQPAHQDLVSLLQRYARKYRRLFVKRCGLSGGRGAFIMEPDSVEHHSCFIDPDHAYIVQECLRNEPYAQ